MDHDAGKIDIVVKVCRILHNMVLHYDGLADVGTDERHWKVVDGDESREFGIRLGTLSTFTVG